MIVTGKPKRMYYFTKDQYLHSIYVCDLFETVNTHQERLVLRMDTREIPNTKLNSLANIFETRSDSSSRSILIWFHNARLIQTVRKLRLIKLSRNKFSLIMAHHACVAFSHKKCCTCYFFTIVVLTCSSNRWSACQCKP